MAVLEGFGLHELIWDAVDGPFGGALVASPADAGGRGIALYVRQDGDAADLTGAEVYLAWRHRVTGARGTEPFDEVDAEAGAFAVFYPAAMVTCEGAVDAQVVVSRGDDTYISSRVFQVRVEPVVIGGTESEDGFTAFLEALSAYEAAGDALTAATEELVEQAEAALSEAVAALETAAGGGYITSATAVTLEAGEEATAEVVDGALTLGIPRGETGEAGADGADGADGVDCTHEWDGTVLSVTSASGTSSADLAGEAGADGVSPTATVEQVDGGAVLTVTDADGTTTATISDGEDGYTPVRGTDYWTEDDVAEIEAYVDARYAELLEEVENGTY